MRSRLAAGIIILPSLVIVVLACATPSPQLSPTPATEPETLRLALASSDLAVGSNRVVFGVLDDDTGPVRDAEVQVSTFYLPATGGQDGPMETVDAVFRAWPVTPRGVFTARLDFDRAGEWGIGAVVTDADGTERKASARVRVKDTSATPALGTAAPRSISKTLADAGDFERLTTDFEPDADLYALTIADALDTGKPLMVVFSTPAYCQTATCGPQLDVIKDVKAEYADTMNFIHVEVYDNPHEIEGDLTNAVISPTVEEWGLPSEPWTFIIDGDGVIRAKFEAFTTRAELDDALALVIN
ncbi:MAG: hypothetical protein OXI16_04165 [Chloroflexota bacterium]|nr:hypothetical protein [Chloroflexota bacterium]